ncbi:TPA: hypothetical protein ACH3X1_012316 [Trebouxia sp. C0004]
MRTVIQAFTKGQCGGHYLIANVGKVEGLKDMGVHITARERCKGIRIITGHYFSSSGVGAAILSTVRLLLVARAPDLWSRSPLQELLGSIRLQAQRARPVAGAALRHK